MILSLQASCHKERHVSQRAVSFIHDVLLEVLSSWAELPHFHFNEALFRPFEHIMQLELCDEDVQDQVNITASASCSFSAVITNIKFIYIRFPDQVNFLFGNSDRTLFVIETYSVV